MKNIDFRTLRADEIEVRPQSIKNGKATMLLYIDSRAVVSLLNETVGNMNWQSEFYQVGEQIIGKIGIYDEDKDIWVWKSDVGSESNVEAEKGKISDTYKRVLSRFGVQELYSAPRITIDDDGYGNSGYKVLEINYDTNRNITHLVIGNRFNKEVFRWDRDSVEQPTQHKPKSYTQTQQNELEWQDETKDNLTVLTDYCSQVTANGFDRSEVGKFFRFYKDKCNSWNGKFDCERLFSNWMSKAKAA